jgi:hypothetical protein
MRRDAAQTIMNLMVEVSGKLNDSIFEVMDSASDQEIERYRHAIGRCMGEIFTEIISPIMAEYPELTPLDLRKPAQP